MVEMVEKEAEDKGNAFFTGGIFLRLTWGIFFLGFAEVFWIMLINFFGIGKAINNLLIVSIIALVPLYLAIAAEYGIYKYRKNRGWSYWKDVTKEWKKERLDQLMREQKESAMRVNAELKGSEGNKSDIRYWHGLLKDGIISQEEFEAKKRELLG